MKPVIIGCPCGAKNTISLDGLLLVGRQTYSERFRCGSCQREFTACDIIAAIRSILGW